MLHLQTDGRTDRRTDRRHAMGGIKAPPSPPPNYLEGTIPPAHPKSPLLRFCMQSLNFVALPVPEIIGCTRKIGQSQDTHARDAPFSPKLLMGFCSDGPSEYIGQILAKFEIRSFSLPEIGVPKKFGQSLDTPTLPFLQSFKRDFAPMDPLNILAKFEIRSFSRS